MSDREIPQHRIRKSKAPDSSALEAVFLDVYPFARRAAEVRSAAAIARRPDLDREDLEQEALVGLWLAIATSGYDSSRASLRTFAERVVAAKLASALRRVSASKRTPRTHPETGERFDVFVRINFRVDMERVLGELGKTDKKVARLLLERTPSEVAGVLGISRQAVYRSMQRIRSALRKAGIGEFL